MKYEQWLAWAMQGFRELFARPEPETELKAKCERWLRLEEERLAHGRMKDALEREQEPLEKELTKLVTAEAGESKSMLREGFRLALTRGKRRQVKWKNEYIAVKSAADAERLQAAQPYDDVFVVERVV